MDDGTSRDRYTTKKICEKTENDLFLDAIISRDYGTVKRMAVENGDLINYVSPFDHSTPLHCACWRRDDDMILLLLQLGADPLIRDNWGHRPLHFATKTGRFRKTLKPKTVEILRFVTNFTHSE